MILKKRMKIKIIYYSRVVDGCRQYFFCFVYEKQIVSLADVREDISRLIVLAWIQMFQEEIGTIENRVCYLSKIEFDEVQDPQSVFAFEDPPVGFDIQELKTSDDESAFSLRHLFAQVKLQFRTLVGV